VIKVLKNHIEFNLFMDDESLANALNQYVNTEGSIPITQYSSFYLSTLRDSILLHNQSQAELLVQAYVGRYFMRSGEQLVVSLANKRINRRELYPEIRRTLLEMMLVVSVATLAFVLVRANAAAQIGHKA
jgi:hypothetical protein